MAVTAITKAREKNEFLIGLIYFMVLERIRVWTLDC